MRDYPNMSYCAFENTLAAVRQCKEILSQLELGREEDCEPAKLGRDEKEAAALLIVEMQEMVDCMKGEVGIAQDDDLTEGEVQQLLTEWEERAEKANENRKEDDDD